MSDRDVELDAQGWELRLMPADHRIIGILFDIADDDSYPGTWEDEINPWDVGLMAIHMEYSEPWEYVWISPKIHRPPTEQQDQKGGKHGTQPAE
jgi:hypothetical protein